MMGDEKWGDDVLHRLADLHKQATVERSHYYTGSVLIEAIGDIARLRLENQVMRTDLKEVRRNKHDRS